jgi:hypothetical protein
MNVSSKVFRALEKIGFEYDPPEDTSAVYKGLISGGEWTKISLYFAEALNFGFYADQSVNKILLENLKVELHNVVGKKCTDPVISDDEGLWIYCTITVANDTTVDWIKSTMEELERRALFLINN